ncbi:hypothetical protein D3C87_1073140 [compost metagenome]
MLLPFAPTLSGFTGVAPKAFTPNFAFTIVMRIPFLQVAYATRFKPLPLPSIARGLSLEAWIGVKGSRFLP